MAPINPQHRRGYGMNIININIGSFTFALDRGGIFIRVPWIGEGWLDFTGNGLSHFDRAS